MALSPAIAASVGRNDEWQPQLETEVRRMLRRARNPFLLAANPLAQALCEATGVPDAQTALRRAIESAFQASFQETRLRDMLLSAAGAGPGYVTQETIPVSKRHFHRRRAKAVAKLAAHIREIIGAPSLAVADEPREHADPLETIAELVSHVEPAMASHIFRLGGPRAVASASILALRERVEAGAGFEDVAGFERSLPEALVAILRAQSLEIGGKQCEGRLWPLLARLGRETADAAEIRFELEWLAFLRARHAGDARQTERVARNLPRLANDRAAWVLRALLAQAEAKVRCGRLDEATALLDAADRRGIRSFAVTELACASALRAEVALQRGEDAVAERLATGAYFVLRGRHFGAYQCQVTIARARLRLGADWSCPHDIGALADTAWDRVALDVELARRCIADGNAHRARSIAGAALQTAQTRNYNGLAARAAATIAMTFGNATQEKRASYLRSLAYLLSTRDRSIGCDLFALEERGLYATYFLRSDDDLVDVLYDGLIAAIPQLHVRSEREAKACRWFLKGLMAATLRPARSPIGIDDAISSLDADAGSFAQFLVHFLDDASELFHAFFAALVPTSERARAEYRSNVALRRLSAIVPRDDLRGFLVG